MNHVVVGYMAIVTGSGIVVGSAHPAVVLIVHGMAVDTRLRII